MPHRRRMSKELPSCTTVASPVARNAATDDHINAFQRSFTGCAKVRSARASDALVKASWRTDGNQEVSPCPS